MLKTKEESKLNQTKIKYQINHRIKKFEEKNQDMAPKVKNTKQGSQTLNIHYRRADNINKSKTFLTRVNYEKLLPFKKRLFSIEFKITKQRFQPMPYEKPVTRSQQRRCSTLNSSNKENQNILSDNPKVD